METSQVEEPQNADLLDPLLTTATCNQCKRQIRPSEYRVVVVAAELGEVPFRITTKIGMAPSTNRRRFLAFCAACACGTDGKGHDEDGSFVRHPLVRLLFGSTRKQIVQDFIWEERFLREIAEEGKLADAERQAHEKELTAAVHRGDDRIISQMLPTSPGKEDLLAHSVGGSIYQSETPRTTVSKDGLRLMAEYLRSPKAHTLKPFQRRVGELYSQGKGQVEIAREIGSSQATVCRAIQGLKAIIHVG